MTTTPIHSTGRGGAGNIGPDTSIYTDGGLVREGIQGESADGEFSTVDLVPEINQRNAQDEFHTGRGGAGNVYKEKHNGHSHSPSARAWARR
ncbi:hypothetical protein PTNB73_09818 [Pyrenophora teres f. teres]|nr:hypothetical protein PTNB73_09818 [Pyrenophora teres f. teres]